MISSTRRNFASRIASLFTGVGAAALLSGSAVAASKKSHDVQKLNYEGKPADPTALFSPLTIHNGTIYISGQGAHSHDPEGKFPTDIETHTTKVLDNVKMLVEAGGGTMESVLQLNVYLASIDDYAGMNKVFKKYFPNGGPARTTVAVSALPGQSLVEINCIAAVVRK
ncbi:MAG: RidA family protein [Acidobacteria bacterium]|jgi:reactive intermediate/imine deaminase|nr:RidA family protein [Acidobacteriota bacterium]